MRDAIYGLLMALSVALVPNLLNVAVAAVGPDVTLGQKCFLIGLLAAGAIAPALFRVSRGSADWRTKIPPRLSWKLGVAGILASCYFLAVVGLTNEGGLGAGVASALDDSLAPVFYMVFLWSWAARGGGAQARGTPSCYFLAGIILVFFGLGFLLWSAKDLGPEWASRNDMLMLVLFGVLGAAGTALSLFLFRLLRRGYNTPHKAVLLWRYGGVVVIYLLATAFHQGYSVTIVSGLIAFISGAACINAAFFFAAKISDDFITAFAQGCSPLLAIGVEVALSYVGVIESSIAFNLFAQPGVLAGGVMVIVGIILFQRDPSPSAILDTMIELKKKEAGWLTTNSSAT